MKYKTNKSEKDNVEDISWNAKEALDIIKNGGYYAPGTVFAKAFRHNYIIFNNWKYESPSGKIIELPGTRQELLDATRVYREEVSASEVPAQYKTTKTGCANEDCMVIAKNLIDQGRNPAILNMANAYKACGNLSGQEGSLCCATTLSITLYQYNKRQCRGIPLRQPSGYPLNLRHGGIYSPNVTVFRSSNPRSGFVLFEETYQTSIISMGALNFNPKIEHCNLEYKTDDGGFTPEGEEIMRDKIRTLYRIALLNGHDSLVLGAFGCKSFHLKPELVSAYFKETLEEVEFKGKFHTIAFALLEGPAGPRSKVEEEGKLGSFYKLFGRL
ncbi:MAG: TIGR02452 family protein [Bacteroidales bacterium]|nr:TIGR02452 family protein [Bacteroidales bacterium]